MSDKHQIVENLSIEPFVINKKYTIVKYNGVVRIWYNGELYIGYGRGG